MKWLKQKNRIYILGLFLVAALLFIPMFIHPYYTNGDTLYHVSNINVLVGMIKENFWDGIFGKIVPLVANNLGYGTRLFYPPLSHTIAAYMAYFLDFLSIDVLTSLKITHFLIYFFSGVIFFYCANRFFKDKKLSFIGALIYMTSAYHINEIYVRDAEAESLLFLFLPLIITAVKELLEGNKKLFYPLFIIGYVGGILSHFTMMIYFTLFLGISMLFFYKKIFKKEFLIPFIKACLLVFLLTAFFFEPLFEHKFFGNYRVYEKWVMSWGIQHTALWGFEYFAPFSKDEIYFYFSIITIILLVVVAKFYRHSFREDKYKLVLIFGILSLWLSTVYFPWILMPYTFFMIQFGWRLVAFVILAVSFIAPLALKEVRSNLLYVAVILGLILSGFSSLHFASQDALDISSLDYNFGMGWQREYLPVNVESNIDYFNSRDENIKTTNEDATITILNNDVPTLEFTVESEEEIEIEMPRIFYFGYSLQDSEGNSYDLWENENGFLSSKVKSGSYTLTFEGTLAYRICLYISLGTLGGIIIYGIYYKFVKRKS